MQNKPTKMELGLIELTKESAWRQIKSVTNPNVTLLRFP
jgi:hypothetical protein